MSFPNGPNSVTEAVSGQENGMGAVETPSPKMGTPHIRSEKNFNVLFSSKKIAGQFSQVHSKKLA